MSVNISSQRLDALVRTRIRWADWTLSSFRVCGVTGLLLALLQGVLLVHRQRLSLLVLAVLVGVVVLTFFGLAMATKIITGKEQLIYYHHEIALMLMAGLALLLLHQPLPPYLDVVILGIGTFLVCGRVGCLMVGCCHGRPCSWGVKYRDEHAAAGFSPHYVGIRLLPVQALESLWVLCVVAVGCWMLVRGETPGSALAWYVMAYDIGRFGFEFLRGDPERAYLGGYSEGQWISVLLMVVVVGAEMVGALPFHLWHVAATAGMALAMFGIALSRHLRVGAKHRLLQPRHVREVAQLLARLVGADAKSEPEGVQVGSTSLGVQISAGTFQNGSGLLNHYALSSVRGVMREEAAQVLVDLICNLKHQTSFAMLISRTRGVFHLLVHSPNCGKPNAQARNPS